jgi:hypothetical protein
MIFKLEDSVDAVVMIVLVTTITKFCKSLMVILEKSNELKVLFLVANDEG